MEISLKKLNKAITYSNKNLEKKIREIVNESSNATILEMFDNSMYIADHKNSEVYQADYSFDGKNLVIENFDKIIIKGGKENLFKEDVKKFFNDDLDSDELLESYENSVSETSDDALSESIANAIMMKNMNNVIDYSELCGINESLAELKETTLFENYLERLNDKPLDKAIYFDFINPVKVSMIDEDKDTFINPGAKKRAKTLKGNKEFRKSLVEACQDLYEGNEETMEDLLIKNASILCLSEQELKELIGFSIIGEGKISSARKAITNRVIEMINESNYLSEKRELLNEEEGEEGEEEEASADTEKLAATTEDLDKLVKALDKALETVEDEKLTKKIEDLKKTIEDAKDVEETPVGAIKECIELLSM